MNWCEYSIIFYEEPVPQISEIKELLKPILREHLWHRRPFQLTQSLVEGFTALRGRTEFGDSILDEWMIVRLLFEISKQFNNGYITIFDNDGQFMLIEASMNLPRWVDPDIMDNRVWIHGGQLHLISPKAAPIVKNIQEAIDFIKLNKSTVYHDIQKDLNRAILQSEIPLHFSHLIVPRNIARALMDNPQIISLATDAFLGRDPIQSKSLHTLRHVDPSSPVAIVCPMTRHMFAALKAVKFYPPKPFLKVESLAKLIYNASRYPKENSWLDIGMKLTCGFELLLRSPVSFDIRNEYFAMFQGKDWPLDCSETFSKETGLNDTEFDQSLQEYNERFEKCLVDDDSWMYVTLEDIDQLLSERAGKQAHVTEDLQKISEKVDNFVNCESSDFLGVCVDSDDDELKRGDDGEDSGSEDDVWENEENLDPEMLELMESIENELMQAGVKEADGNEHLNILKNVMQSFAAQEGASGPVQTILNSLGVSLPPDEEFKDDSESDMDKE